MFTGIVRAIGNIVTARNTDGALEIVIAAGGLSTAGWRSGDSICVAGVCLTAVNIDADSFSACVSRETRERTTLGSLAAGDRVNLEPSLAAGDPLGGHHVTGHVDGVARISGLREDAGSLGLMIDAPAPFARYLAPKGSVTLDGVSLTINEVSDHRFGVNLVPHTRAMTTLGAARAGQAVNLEIDIIARYLGRLLDAQRPR